MKEKDNWKVDNWQVSRAESWLPLVMRVWRDAAQACMGGGGQDAIWWGLVMAHVVSIHFDTWKRVKKKKISFLD